MSSQHALWQDVAAEVAPPLPPATEPGSPIQQRRRRGFNLAADDGREAVELVRDDGVLRWVWRESELSSHMGARRAWRAAGTDPRSVVQRFEYRPLGSNRITEGLVSLDLKLNPERGLRAWKNGSWRAVSATELAALRGRVLLLVHGTFSKSAMYDNELRAPGWEPDGKPSDANQRLWQDWTTPGKPYAVVLAFDHATLSLAPWLNALELVQALAPLGLDGTKVQLDVVCHSRGGLVTAWALKMAPLPVARVVFVGSPLVGTSLAAPDRLAAALDFLANVADTLAILGRGAAMAFPPFAPLALGAAGLAKVLGKTLHLGAALPLADAVVGLVPGLMAQSRVANNLEIERLFPLPTHARLYGMGGEFKPDEVREPVWKFWKRFSHLADQAKYYGADIIFDQSNDLVVDVDSMNRLGLQARLPDVDWRDLGPSPRTHHCSYFRDAETIEFLRAKLR